MFETNPVLAGKFDGPTYSPAANNVAGNTLASDDAIDRSQDTPATSSIDSRRYTQFDRTATEAGTATLSFGDILDMINPLQHIPVVSSVYRAITGETINPVSRVAGDIMFSGPLGAVSAAISGVGAISNSVIETSTGKDATGNMLASLFGGDDAATTASSTMLADAGTTAASAVSLTSMTGAMNNTAPALAAAAAAPVTKIALASASPLAKTSTQTSPATAPLTSPTLSNSDITNSMLASNAAVSSSLSKLLPLDRSRINQNMTAASNDIESQNRIISLNEGSRNLRIGNTIYTGTLMNGPKPMPARSTMPPAPATTLAPTVATPSASIASATPNDTTAATLSPPTNGSTAAQTAPANNPVATGIPMPLVANASAEQKSLPPALFDDVMVLKRLNQYKNFATAPAASGSSIDIQN